MKYSIATTLLLSGLIFLAACKKNNLDGVPPPPPKPGTLVVKLAVAYLGSALVDSAFASWIYNGAEQRVKLEVRNDSMLAPLAAFTEGLGELRLHIFSSMKFNTHFKSQWVLSKTLKLQKNNAIGLEGPANFNDVNWKPRVLIKDLIGHQALVGLRPNDPYFLVKDPGHLVEKLSVERAYWKTIGGVQFAGGGVWQCTTGCLDTANETFFSTLPEMIGTKPWNHISILVLFESETAGQGWVISMEHDI